MNIFATYLNWVECNLVWNHTRDFKIERARSAGSIWNHKYDFRPELHDTKFNCHFIRSILKSYNFIALNSRFWCIVPLSRFVKNSGTGNAFTSHLECKTMACDENSFEHNKGTSSSEVRTKTVNFMHKSSILVAWINDGRPSFPLWLRLRLLVVFGEGIWRRYPCNSAMDFFWVVKLPRVHDVHWIVFLLEVPVGTLHDFRGFQLVIISVSFCDLGVELYTQDLVKFLRRHLFQDIFKMAGLHQEDVRSLTVLWSGAYFDYVYSQWQSWALALLRLKLPETWRI